MSNEYEKIVENNLLSRVMDKVEYNTYTEGDHPAGKDLPVFYSPLNINRNGISAKRVHKVDQRMV